MEREKPGTGAYAVALVLTIVCLALANFVVAYLGGFADIDSGKPGAVAVGFAQGLAGAMMTGIASSQILKSVRPSDFWLKWIVILVGALFAVAIVWALVIGKSERALTWMTFGGVASLIGTEVGRRMTTALAHRSPSL